MPQQQQQQQMSQQQPRTWLELANDATSPNAPHARACIEDRIATFTIYALVLECVLEARGIAPPQPETRRDAIRRRLRGDC